MDTIQLINSDCLIELTEIQSQSVDLILTDPPYNLGLFMQERDTNLKKMRDNFFGSADWDNLDYDSWKAHLETFFKESGSHFFSFIKNNIRLVLTMLKDNLLISLMKDVNII